MRFMALLDEAETHRDVAVTENDRDVGLVLPGICI